MEHFTKSLNSTVDAFGSMPIVLYLGFDVGDAIYDNEENMREIVSTISQIAPLLTVLSQ